MISERALLEPDMQKPSAYLAQLIERMHVSIEPNETLEIAKEVERIALCENAQEVVVDAMLMSGESRHKLGQFEQALEVLTLCEEKAVLSGLVNFEFEAHLTKGRIYLDLGKFDSAQSELQYVIETSRKSGNDSAFAKALNIFAGLQHARGDSLEALESLKQALNVHRMNFNYHNQAMCLINIGVLYTDQSDYPHALENLIEARGLLGSYVSNPRQEGNCLINLGRVYEYMHDYHQAVSIYTEALALSQRSGDQSIEAIASVNLGAAHKLLEQPETALPLFQRGLEIAREIGLRQIVTAALDGIGTVQTAFGEFSAALESHREALFIARETGYREQEIESLVNLARVHLASANPNLALPLLLEALPLAEQAELQKFVVDTHCLLAETYEAVSDLRSALRHHREYHRLERSQFSEESERRTRHLKMTFELERARTETEVIREANELLEGKVSARTRELEEARVEVVTRLAVAAEYRDDATGQHTSRVGTLAASIAERLGLSAEEIELLRLAARLHDVGKIGISDLLLLKPGKLTPEEFGRIKEHTVIGAQILSGGQSPLLQLAEVIALTHHERWDGRGYPHGLTGEAIPLPGRIVAVADVYDALLSIRAYKTAWTPAEARAEIERQVGTQFDPAVVKSLLEILDAQT